MSGERLLVVMVLRQIALDLWRGGPEVRAEALHFVNDLQALTTWTDVLDLDAHDFRQQVLKRRGRGRPCA
jgi:hypothetical protein